MNEVCKSKRKRRKRLEGWFDVKRRKKTVCIYVCVCVCIYTFLDVLFNARMTRWPREIGFRPFSFSLSFSLRFFDKISGLMRDEEEEEMNIKKRRRRRKSNQMFIFSNKHTRQKKWFRSFISIDTLMRCVHLLINTHTHIGLIDILAGTYSFTSCLFLCRPSNNDDDGQWTKKSQWMALMTDIHRTHKCRQESIEWSMSHPKRSLTWVAFACWLAIVIIRPEKKENFFFDADWPLRLLTLIQGYEKKDNDNWTLEVLTWRCRIILMKRLTLVERFSSTCASEGTLCRWQANYNNRENG